jgi:lysophospholipase L1-like esterase
MIGDSYLDRNWSLAGDDLIALAQMAGSLPAMTTYREYQLGGAAMNNGSLGLNIPYQYETQAKTDIAYMNPAKIDTVIMDGGGNDVIIDQQSCMTSPPPTNAACTSTITGAVNRAGSLLQEMAHDGVKHIVYFFYPHLDPAGGGLLPTPSPDVNVTLDYAYPLAQEVCCGTTFTPTASHYTCKGTTAGTECIFVDMRPACEGHVADYIKTDHVHPTPAGAQVIANEICATMQANCIAQ